MKSYPAGYYVHKLVETIDLNGEEPDWGGSGDTLTAVLKHKTQKEVNYGKTFHL